MSPRITHSKVSGKPNPTDASKVGGEDWDADHVIDGLTIGTDVQAHDTTLDALAAFDANGIIVQYGTDQFTARTLTGTANEIAVANGAGASGNPTFSLPSALTFTGKTVTGGTFTSGTWNGSTIGVAYGGTGLAIYTLGDVIYASAGTTLSKLAGNTTTTRKFLRQTGDGTNSAAPAWDTITAADVPGSALTRTNDTNVTLTLGGSPTTALLNAASITVGWSGTLAASRGGFGADVSAQSGVPLFATGVPTFTGTTGSGNFVRATSPTISGTISADQFAPTGAGVPANGLYLPAANAIGLATNSTERLRIGSTGDWTVNADTVLIQSVATNSSAHSLPQLVLRSRDQTTPTGAGGFMRFQSYNSSAAVVDAVQLNGGMITTTAGAENGDLDINIYRSGTNRVIALRGDWSAFAPSDTNMWSLGKSGNEWSNVYSVLGTFSSTLSAAQFAPTGAGVPANGLYLPAANTLGFASASTAQGSISSTGDWSIGTSAGSVSTSKLVVQGNANSSHGIQILNNSSSGSALAQFIVATGLANTSLSFNVQNNSGTPLAQLKLGSAVANFYFDTEVFNFRNAAGGTTYATLGSSGFNIQSGSLLLGGTQVVGARDTGWTAMTGTANKNTAYDTSTVTLAQLAGRVMSLQAALATHGLIGT